MILMIYRSKRNTTSIQPCQSQFAPSFVDVNGDCLPDLIFQCATSIQIFINKGVNGFILKTTYDMPTGSGQITAKDMNADGSVDLAFGRCEGIFTTNCYLAIVYNSQVPYCVRGNLGCRTLDNLCVGDDGFEFDFKNVTENTDINLTTNK